MRWQLAVGAVAIVACVITIASPIAASAGSPCSLLEIRQGTCDIDIDAGLTPDGVDLIGGGESVSGGGAGGESVGGGFDGGVAEPVLPPALGSDETPKNDNGLPPGCTGAPDVCDPELVVTWNDIASFRASAPQLAMEPDGWAVRGLPTNFVATASVEVIAGSLLGFPADVRFTPVGYAWDYGDGATGYSVSGGSSWGAAAFSETATSHTYTKRGDFAASVAVELSAEYRFGGGAWRPISGTIRLAGTAAPVSVKSATTVLVAGSCVGRPADPGC